MALNDNGPAIFQVNSRIAVWYVQICTDAQNCAKCIYTGNNFWIIVQEALILLKLGGILNLN